MDLEIVKENLEKRGYTVKVFQKSSEAADYLDKVIDKTAVGIGGSVTVREMKLFDMLASHNEVWWHNDGEQLEKYGDMEIRMRAAGTKVYISSVNGMSMEGHIINIDGTGNRVAATCFGHEKLYFIVGKNKIEDTLEKAIWRARNIAAPKNAQRLGLKTPCAVKGDKCYDCASPSRICRGFLIMEGPFLKQDAEIILVNENLGY